MEQGRQKSCAGHRPGTQRAVKGTEAQGEAPRGLAPGEFQRKQEATTKPHTQLDQGKPSSVLPPKSDLSL